MDVTSRRDTKKYRGFLMATHYRTTQPSLPNIASVVLRASWRNIPVSLIDSPEPVNRGRPLTSEGNAWQINKGQSQWKKLSAPLLSYAGWACISATTASRWVNVSSIVRE